jgi:hypothetical protein
MSSLLGKIKSLFSPAVTPRKSTGLIGANLPASQEKHDLFNFFNFAPVGTEALSGQRVATAFKPTGEAFHELVTLYVTTDAQGTIQVLRLVVARSFIDNPATCIYAADLVKSFLGSINFASREDKIAVLAGEISARGMARSSMPMITAQPLPKAEGAPSPAYQTYAGNGTAQTLFNPEYSVQLLLQNDLWAEPPALEIILSAKARSSS